MRNEQVILVDADDREIGTMDKMEAHRKGKLHRAFSVLLFNSNGELLIQKRALSKYHSAGLWTNTCCSHPLPNESVAIAAQRRLQEEMGISLKPSFAYKFIYKTQLDCDLIEHECDHVLVGEFDGKPTPNKHEAADWKFVSLQTLRKEVAANPEHFTYWFRRILTHKMMLNR